ncbi:hypothetical protein HOC35_01795 [Candidatus Woesearchaeota archaeon]|jgi:hypothetical protein|nr:hypothetical protein [Candidatus Woesearchaeota archaeon]
MNRAQHKRLFKEFVYDRGDLTRLSSVLQDDGAITDKNDLSRLQQLLGKEDFWTQHNVFYNSMSDSYQTLRHFSSRWNSGKENEDNVQKDVEAKKEAKERKKVVPLNALAQEHLEREVYIPDTDEIIEKKDIEESEANNTQNQDLDSKLAGLEQEQTIKAIQAKPTRYVLDHMKDIGVGGEEKNILSVLYSILGGVNVMFISPSGSGKTVILDACLSLFPEDQIYKMISSTNAAEVRNFEEMNKARIGYILEAKNYLGGGGDNEHYKMILCLAEGKNYTKRLTSSTKNQETGEREITELVLEANKSFITADAIESYLDINEEMRRRFVELMTDTSDEHRKEIIKVVARKMSGLGDKTKVLSDQVTSTLKSYVEEAMGLQGITIVNPFYESISEMIPSSAMRSNSYTKSLFKMISGSALLHHKDRIISDGKLYVELQDVYNVMEVYFQQMCKSMVGYPVFGDDIMEVINEHVEKDQSETYSDVDEVHFTADDIYERVRQVDGYSRITIKTVEAILEELYTCKCLEKKKQDFRSKNPAYTLAEEMPFIDISYSWEKGLENAYEHLETENQKLAEFWLEKQVQEGNVMVYNSILGSQTSLFHLETLLEDTTTNCQEVDPNNTDDKYSTEINNLDNTHNPNNTDNPGDTNGTS